MRSVPTDKGTWLQALGPGLLMAGAAVGVSHLVQATRAGAEYGLLLLGLVLLACVLKYPFLEFGPRYTAATGESLLDGYRRMGRWAMGLYALITIGTMFVILAGVTLVTAGLAARLFAPDLPPSLWSAIVLAICGAILLVGRFRGLDLSMKVIMVLLSLLTLAAMSLALANPGDWGETALTADPATLWTGAGIAFLLALMGWMPIPLDVAAWHSLWAIERSYDTGRRPSLRHALLDFKIGYIGATVLAACFLVLGAMVMFGRGEGFDDSAVAFSSQFAALYGETLGDWSVPVILFTALIVMFSTTLAVSDAYPRVLSALTAMVRPSIRERRGGPPAVFAGNFFLVAIGTLILIHFFGGALTTLVDFATTVSFLSAPILAWLNLRLVTGPLMPAEHRPGTSLRVLAIAGLVFLVGFSLLWAYWRLFGG